MNPSQANSLLFFFFFIIFLNHHHNHYVSAQSQYSPPPYPLYLTNDLYKPSLAIITGVFSIVFALTFILLVYAKCFSNDLRSETDVADRDQRGIFNLSSRFSSSSGLNKTAIESLPFFRFSALKGSKQGLECSVCLSKFEDVEILRLLPKCKHAFHISCIDTWLEQHATCPLCRNRVSVEDDISVLGFSSNNNNSLRLMNQSQSRQNQEQDQEQEQEQDFTLEIYIEREEEGISSDGSSRFSSFRKILNFGKKETALFLDEQGNEKKPMHKFNHRIFVSDLTFKNRWSNVTSSDLNYLTSEMLNSMSSDRFSSLDRVNGGNLCYKEDVKLKKKKKKESTRRAVSEITGVPRVSIGGNGSVLDASTASTSKNDETEERRRRLWLPIASRTAHWFVNRDKSNEVNVTRQNLNV